MNKLISDYINKPVRSFMIHLSRATERKTLINSLKTYIGEQLEIVEAVDGTTLPTDFPMNCPYLKGSKRSHGDVGCTLSHVKIFEKMINENIEYSLIYEDDCIFNEKERINNFSLESLPKNFDCLLLGSLYYQESKSHSNNFITTTNFWGTHALVISLECAKKLLSFYHSELKKGVVHPADGHYSNASKEHSFVIFGVKDPKKYFDQNNGKSYIR